jgi:hypothetical protein
MLVRVVMVVCLLLAVARPVHAEGGTPGVVVLAGAVKDERGKPIKLRRGDKVVVLAVSGGRAQVTVKGRTAWVPLRMLLVAKTAPKTPPGVPEGAAPQEPAPEEPAPRAPSRTEPAPASPAPVALPCPAAEPAPPTLRVTSEPGGALVTIDGHNVGITPLHPINLARGSHRVEVALEGHQPLTQDVVVEGETLLAVSPRLLVSSEESAPTTRALWPRLLAPVPVVLAGLLSTALMGVGVAGALLWVASANALVLRSTGFTFKDSAYNTAASTLGNQAVLFVAAGMTVAGPVLALLVGALGALAGLAIMNL